MKSKSECFAANADFEPLNQKIGIKPEARLNYEGKIQRRTNAQKRKITTKE
jgi:hypothetical protein